jgi:uncharacterized protein (TIGR03118 family)
MSRLIIAALIIAAPALVRADNSYVQHNLVSDKAGIADHLDANLVNPWGIDRSPTGPWWVSDNKPGVSTVYDGSGNVVKIGANPLVVTIPPPGATGTSAPTGIVFNGSADFQVAPGKPAFFIFVTEDGTISGWNPDVNLTKAIRKAGDGTGIYKGVTIGQISGKNHLYAANFHAGSVDVFDAAYQPVSLAAGAFKDTTLPADYAPFNVQHLGGNIVVAFAKQDAAKHDDVPGAGLGYVDVFTSSGVLVKRLEHGKWFNAPWAIVLAPGNFGKLSNRLLVGNFGSGEVASFDPSSGEFEGMMRGPQGKKIAIEGLWDLKFGNNATAGAANVLFFAAGIDGENHGLFGTLKPTQPQAGEDTDDNNDKDDGDH